MVDTKNLVVSADDLEDCILALESRSGQPVEVVISLRVKTAVCESTVELGTYGTLKERPLEVKKVEGLVREYKRDMNLLEGKYANLKALDLKIEEYNLIYGLLHSTSAAIERQSSAESRVAREFNLPRGDINLGFNLHTPQDQTRNLYGHLQRGLVPRDKVFDLLRREGFSFLEHIYVARVNGIYALSGVSEKMGENSLCARSEMKVADVRISLLFGK